MDTFANSVDPDETARNKLSYQGLTVCHSIIDFWLNPYLQQWMCLNSEMDEPTSETQGWKG